MYNSREGARLNGGSKAHIQEELFFLSLSLLSHSVKNWTSSPPAPPLALSLPSVCVTQLPAAESLSTHTKHTRVYIEE